MQMRWIKDDDEINIMRRGMYFSDFSVKVGRDFVESHGTVSENEILKAAADALADKMASELNEVVGVGIDPPQSRKPGDQQAAADFAGALVAADEARERGGERSRVGCGRR